MVHVCWLVWRWSPSPARFEHLDDTYRHHQPAHLRKAFFHLRLTRILRLTPTSILSEAVPGRPPECPDRASATTPSTTIVSPLRASTSRSLGPVHEAPYRLAPFPAALAGLTRNPSLGACTLKPSPVTNTTSRASIPSSLPTSL